MNILLNFEPVHSSLQAAECSWQQAQPRGERPTKMTTAARPTFHPAVGGEDQGYFRMEAGTKQISVKDMPGHTRLKQRKMEAAKSREALKAELEDRERAAKAGKKDGDTGSSAPSLSIGSSSAPLQLGAAEAEKDADDIDAANVEVRTRLHVCG